MDLPMLILTLSSVAVTGIVSVYDGDTFRARLDCSTALFCENMPIRVNGVDTPEIRGKCEAEKVLARKAKYFASQALGSGEVVLHNVERGKYFRLVADVEINGLLLSEMLIEAGLGRRYDGGKRQGWCD